MKVVTKRMRNWFILLLVMIMCVIFSHSTKAAAYTMNITQAKNTYDYTTKVRTIKWTWNYNENYDYKVVITDANKHIVDTKKNCIKGSRTLVLTGGKYRGKWYKCTITATKKDSGKMITESLGIKGIPTKLKLVNDNGKGKNRSIFVNSAPITYATGFEYRPYNSKKKRLTSYSYYGIDSGWYYTPENNNEVYIRYRANVEGHWTEWSNYVRAKAKK